MTANDSKSYFDYLDKLIHEYNNTVYRFADYFALTLKVGTNPKAPKFKVDDRVKNAKHKNIFSKGYSKNWSGEIVIDSVLKTNPCIYIIKDSKQKK